jgi:hypothetical protein
MKKLASYTSLETVTVILSVLYYQKFKLFGQFSITDWLRAWKIFHHGPWGGLDSFLLVSTIWTIFHHGLFDRF